VQSPLIWSTDPSWKLDYSNLEKLSPAEVARLSEEAEHARITARELRMKSVGG
jgi:hypothetical protein